MKGLRFQKRIRLPGGFRINLSKSGIGFSAGVPGFRMGIDSKNRRYSSIGLPGSGVSMRRYLNVKDSRSRLTDAKLRRGTLDIPKLQKEADEAQASADSRNEILRDRNQQLANTENPLKPIARFKCEQAAETAQFLVNHYSQKAAYLRGQIAEANALDIVIAREEREEVARNRIRSLRNRIALWCAGLSLCGVILYQIFSSH
jgi:hypothetical protein